MGSVISTKIAVWAVFTVRRSKVCQRQTNTQNVHSVYVRRYGLRVWTYNEGRRCEEVKHMPLKWKARPSRRRARPARARNSLRGRGSPIQNSENPVVSVIIPAMNERKTIATVITHARDVHPQAEVIVVVNGSTDGTEAIARRMGANVHRFEQPLGHDVGRAIGAERARGDILLFMDGDIVIPAAKLRPFVTAILSGTDVALNRYCGKTNTVNAHSVVIAKHALNAVLRRNDLTGASMTTTPHAISRKALREIGAEHLAVPPLALTVAAQKDLVIKKAAFVEVGRSNPKRRRHHKEDPLKQLIVGDHVEAIAWLLAQSNERGGFTDLVRRRDRVRGSHAPN